MIRIIEENNFFVVLSKPKGTSVHNQSPSVAEFLLNQRLSTHFVNRLDQDTSGLMVVAKTPDMHTQLSTAIQESGRKVYRCLLRGSISQFQSESRQVWQWAISDKAEGRKNPQGKSADRKEARTEIEFVRNSKFFTEVMATISTGRQHQIRKHCVLAGHPIVGDYRYNDSSYNSRIEKLYGDVSLQLHAESLYFNFQNQNFHFIDRANYDRFFTS